MLSLDLKKKNIMEHTKRRKSNLTEKAELIQIDKEYNKSLMKYTA